MVAGAVLALAACSSSPDWMSFGTSGPMLDTVSFEFGAAGCRSQNIQRSDVPYALLACIAGRNAFNGDILT